MKIIILVLTLWVSVSLAQEVQPVIETPPPALPAPKALQKNVIKLNFTKLLQGVTHLQYERALNPKLSLAAGLSYVDRKLPKFIRNLDNTGTLNDIKFTGFSITPELRWYPSNIEKDAPRGFYLAPYLKYASYSIDFPYKHLPGTTYNFTGNFSALGGGLLMGAQWIAKKGFTFDWWILGFHYGGGKVTFTAEGDFLALAGDQPEIKSIENKINESFSKIPLLKVIAKATVDPNKIELNFPGLPYAGIRAAGFNFGYAF